jgi:hypothetical protein
MVVAFWVGVVLLGSLSTAKATAPKPDPVPMGDNTYSLTRSARFAFSFSTDKLEKKAREDAGKFCAGMGKKMKEVSISAEKASLIHGGFSKATIIFKALDPADTELADAPIPVARSSDLEKLVDLHDKKLLSDAEFEAARKRLNEKSSDLGQLLELKRKGILTDAEFEAARNRLMERAK